MSLILVFFMWVSYVNACPLSYCTNCYGGGWGGPSSCGQCQTYYGVYNSYCLPCNYNQSNCQLCSTTNWNACITCMTGYALNTTTAKCFNCNLNGGCDLCQPTNSGTIVCTKCHIRHVLISPNCFQCLDPKCLECQASNQNICTKCEDYYGVDLLGGQNCVSCDVTNCLDCSTNRTTCYACIDGYGVDMNYGVASCRPCSDSDCIICAQDYRICTFCSPGLGPRVYADWSCGRCNYRYCELCSAHRFICTYCQLGYGVSRIDSVNYECKDCADANCLNCS